MFEVFIAMSSWSRKRCRRMPRDRSSSSHPYQRPPTGVGNASLVGILDTRQMLKLNCLPPHGRPPRLPAPAFLQPNFVRDSQHHAFCIWMVHCASGHHPGFRNP
eukprot:symbB.v1.2.012298.t1/scaffold844.1/size158302/1